VLCFQSRSFFFFIFSFFDFFRNVLMGALFGCAGAGSTGRADR